MMKKGRRDIISKISIVLFFFILINLNIEGFTSINVNANTSPLLNVPLNSWVYPILQKFDAMNFFQGENEIAIHSKPLTRREIAALVNRILINVQKERVILNKTQINHLERLVNEFEKELKEYGVRVVNQELSYKEMITQYQSDDLYQTVCYFINEGYIDHPEIVNFPISRQHLAGLVSQMVFSLQSGQLKKTDLTEIEVEYLDFLVTELKDELAFYGIRIVYLNRSKVLINHLQESLSISGYLNQTLHLTGQNQWDNNQKKKENTNKALQVDQGLLKLQFGTVLTGELWEDVPFLIDLSVDANIHDVYQIDLTALNLGLNKSYLKFKTNSFKLTLFEKIPILSVLDEFEFPEINWQIGRDEMRWGPCHSGSLILSNNASPLDMIVFSGNFDLDQIAGNFGHLHFTKFYSLLDEKRLLFGQRFEYSPDTPWRIALSETAIAAQNCGIAYFNPIPFPLSSYMTQQIYSHFPDLSNRENNINYHIGLDLQYQLNSGMKIYGEMMFDDFIFYQKENPFPGRYGLTLGSHIPQLFSDEKTDLILEYTRINNYVYYPRQEWQYYLFQGEYLGHPLGPDADQITIELNHQFNEHTTLQFAYIHERHGEGQIGIPLPADANLANENQFLSGILEKSHQFLASIKYNFLEDWQISFTGSLKNTYNQDNQLNQNNQELSLTAIIQYDF